MNAYIRHYYSQMLTIHIKNTDIKNAWFKVRNKAGNSGINVYKILLVNILFSFVIWRLTSTQNFKIFLKIFTNDQNQMTMFTDVTISPTEVISAHARVVVDVVDARATMTARIWRTLINVYKKKVNQLHWTNFKWERWIRFKRYLNQIPTVVS